ncbi:type II secretion system protein M [Zestomonas carbonaria]|uniref:Type II secretion system protein M n=1 Tax=Zestomonas carbonaria TaxID=2762745 RepID=A0A7U7IAU9_9GAMM|nr:type II secretion system protein M [Pseudomonas carbonaria]CAD5109765.1 Type II secretion system protein M [Pseudomonas carbonaria]
MESRGLNAPLAVRLEQSPWFQRWRALAPRDRLALAVLGGFLLLVLLYLLLWRPVEQQRDAARRYFEQQRELNVYLQAWAPLARGARERPQTSVDPARLQGLVTASAAEHGLAVERLDGEGEGGVQVSLQAAPFARLLGWFAALEGQGVRIDEAGLDRTGEGLVAARLTLRAGP